VNYNHQDLSANMWNGGFSYPNHGYNFTTEGATNDPMDLFGHGTHVAGIIGAVGNNALGSVGVCWKATIMAVRVLDATGTGSTATIISGINFAVSNGAKVINMSLGGGVAFDQAYSNAITNAQINDVVVVVSAGNEGANNDINGNAKYPCNFTNPNLICVAALDQNYSLASFSNWGSVSVDVGAPGTNMLSLWAGATSTYTDPMNMNAGSTMWLVSSNPASHQFTFGHDVPNVYPYNGGTYYSLNYPGVAYWPSGYAPANTSTYLWATLNLSGINAATLDIFGAVHVVSDGGLGSFAIAYNPAGGNPFSGTPTYFSGTSPQATDLTPAFTPIFSAVPTLSLANCLTSTCTVGFQYKTGYTTFNLGASIVGFTINALTLNNSTYKLEDGTSMASPLVAGLATMLRAYNPQFTSDDVVAAIENGGSPVASLAGITKTGNAVNAIKSLAYIKAPTGLSASVQ
jgi:subtilisin family serine protease